MTLMCHDYRRVDERESDNVYAAGRSLKKGRGIMGSQTVGIGAPAAEIVVAVFFFFAAVAAAVVYGCLRDCRRVVDELPCW